MMGKLEFMMLRLWKRVQKLVPRTLAASHLIFFLKTKNATKILDATSKIKAMDIFLAKEVSFDMYNVKLYTHVEAGVHGQNLLRGQ